MQLNAHLELVPHSADTPFDAFTYLSFTDMDKKETKKTLSWHRLQKEKEKEFHILVLCGVSVDNKKPTNNASKQKHLKQ